MRMGAGAAVQQKAGAADGAADEGGRGRRRPYTPFVAVVLLCGYTRLPTHRELRRKKRDGAALVPKTSG